MSKTILIFVNKKYIPFYRLRLFDIKQSSNIVNVRAHPTEILSLDWSKYDDHLLVTGSCDNRLHLWDIRMINSAVNSFEGHQAAIRRVKFDPYRRDYLASAGYDGYLKLWNLTSRENKVRNLIKRNNNNCLTPGYQT